MKKNKFKIIGLGEILWDVYGDEKFAGGAPANFLRHIAVSGHEAVILSRVGNDADGIELINDLKNNGININYIQIDKTKPTGLVNITLDEQSKPSFQILEDTAYDYFENNDNWNKLSDEADAVVFGTLAQRGYSSHITIQAFLKSAVNSLKVFDLNVRGAKENIIDIVFESLRYTDILKINESELEIFRKEFNSQDNDISLIKKIINDFKLKLVAVTFGNKGCLCVDNIDYVYHPGFIVNAVDTTGSGDGFTAGLVIKYLEGAGLKEIAEFGNKLGAFIATKKGPCPLWTLKDLEEIK